MDMSFATLLLVFCWCKVILAWLWHCWWFILNLICSWNVFGQAFVLFDILKMYAIRYKTACRLWWFSGEGILQFFLTLKLLCDCGPQTNWNKQKISLYHKLITSETILSGVLCGFTWAEIWYGPTLVDNAKNPNSWSETDSIWLKNALRIGVEWTEMDGFPTVPQIYWISTKTDFAQANFKISVSLAHHEKGQNSRISDIFDYDTGFLI